MNGGMNRFDPDRQRAILSKLSSESARTTSRWVAKPSSLDCLTGDYS